MSIDSITSVVIFIALGAGKVSVSLAVLEVGKSHT